MLATTSSFLTLRAEKCEKPMLRGCWFKVALPPIEAPRGEARKKRLSALPVVPEVHQLESLYRGRPGMALARAPSSKTVRHGFRTRATASNPVPTQTRVPPFGG